MIAEYIAAGWALCAIPPRQKGPITAGWNLPENALKSEADLPPGHGVGLMHLHSDTASLDVDDLTLAEAWLAERNVDLQQLLTAADAVLIHSGNPGHAKLIYSLPGFLAMPSKRVMLDGKVVLEFRQATAGGTSMQDVLPPSIHPNGHAYTWQGRGDWKALPALPDVLLTIWQQLLDEPRAPAAAGVTPATMDEIKGALFSIDPDCPREVWINVMFGLEDACRNAGQPEVGYQLFDQWSSTSKKGKYPGSNETLKQWKSAKPNGGVTAGTLFAAAFASGWKRPVPDVTEMFRPVPPQEPYEDLRETMSPRAMLPDCDLSLWPEQLRNRAIEVANEVGCDPIVPLLAGLSAVSAAADKRIKLNITNTWNVPPTVWLMTLGEPADKKTPGSKPMFNILKTIEGEHRDMYAAQLLAWKGLEARHAAQLKHFREWSASPEAEMPNQQAPEVVDLPPQPEPLRLLIQDATTQKLVNMAAARPRGFLLWLDEMQKWLTRLGDKTTTDDRGAWIAGYETGGFTMDRMGAGTVHAENFALSLYGNCQPEVFRRNVGEGASDGLIQRFMPVLLDAGKNRMWQQPVPHHESFASEYDTLIRRTFTLPVFEYEMMPEAMQLFREFSAWILHFRSLERILEQSSAYNTAIGKAEGNCARIILLFHLILEPYSPFVSADTAARAIALYQEFMLPSLRYVFLEMAQQRSKIGEMVLDYVIQNSAVKPVVTMGDLRRAVRHGDIQSTPQRVDEEILMAMDELIGRELAWIHQGHPRNPTFAINSTVSIVFAERRKELIVARQDRVDRFRQNFKNRTGHLPTVRNAPGYDELRD